MNVPIKITKIQRTGYLYFSIEKGFQVSMRLSLDTELIPSVEAQLVKEVIPCSNQLINIRY